MYNIVLIDDDKNEFAKIRRTIKTNAPEKYSFDNDYKFKEFSLEEFNTQEEIVNKLVDLIRNKDVSLIIIDYKLLTEKKLFEGNKIFAQICKTVSRFPIVILTELLNDSLNGLLVDADKIYEKQLFFKLESGYSKEKVKNLFYNMESYAQSLSELERELNLLIDNMQKNKMTVDLINRINEVETELVKFIPLDYCQAEELYNADDLKEVIKLLVQVNTLIKG